MSVSEPYEFWDMDPGEVRVVLVERWAEGFAEIVPRYPGAPSKKRIQVLRLYLKSGVKPTLPYFWDVTSKHLIAALKPFLTQEGFRDREYVIGKVGVAPRARFTLEVRPV